MATVVSEHHKDIESSVRPLGGLGSVPSAPASLLRLLRRQGGAPSTNGSIDFTSDKNKKINPIRRILRRASLGIATTDAPVPLRLESRSLSEEKAPDDAYVAPVAPSVESVTDKSGRLAIPKAADDFDFDFATRLCPLETTPAITAENITSKKGDEEEATAVEANEYSPGSPTTTKEQSPLPGINEASEIGPKSISAQEKSPEIDEELATIQHAPAAPPYPIVAVDKKWYVSPEMPIAAEIVALWEESIKGRLENEICSSTKATDDSEAALALEFYMAGKTRKHLSPSIIITCCSSRRKKELRSDLEELKWLKDSHLRYFVRVDKSFGHRSEGWEVKTPSIEAKIQLDIASACGVAARLKSISLRTGSEDWIPFTLGGIVSLGPQLCYLTAGHPFREQSDVRSQPGLSDIDDDSDSDSVTSSGLESISSSDSYGKEESGGVEPSRKDGKEIPFTPLPGTLVYRKMPRQSLKYDIMTNKNTYVPCEGEYQNPDWALVQVPIDESIPQSNIICIPGEENPTLVSDWMPRSDISTGQVWVAAGSGLQQGTVVSTPASIFSWGSFRDVRQIILRRKLVRGDSGSWVIRNGMLCGYIVAGRDLQPWAYMVLIEDIFADINSFDPATLQVSIPGSEAFDIPNTELVEAVKQVTFASQLDFLKEDYYTPGKGATSSRFSQNRTLVGSTSSQVDTSLQMSFSDVGRRLFPSLLKPPWRKRKPMAEEDFDFSSDSLVVGLESLQEVPHHVIGGEI
ncbi:hypothetical protein BKA64DRAFT_708897 [Cadophora sp. MPI-SDFR-AT-0126]|nr:hypothetical protein BKA64DRAFT_708897 [Leotiomycetes sp. MPI-SDFR-AT-0126]